jgi:hypothetical protein
VVAVDTTGINSTPQSNYSSPAFAGLFLLWYADEAVIPSTRPNKLQKFIFYL